MIGAAALRSAHLRLETRCRAALFERVLCREVARCVRSQQTNDPVTNLENKPGQGVFLNREASESSLSPLLFLVQSVMNPGTLAIPERWTVQAALDAHAEHSASVRPEMRAGKTVREDYAYNRTR